MAFLLPGSFQKRLLRYALSRLELVDTDALDLENLDVAIGKRSTVELKDVGLHVEVCFSLLENPKLIIVETCGTASASSVCSPVERQN
jgi:autophagy-related protein 2